MCSMGLANTNVTFSSKLFHISILFRCVPNVSCLPRWTWRSEAEVRRRCLPGWRGVPYVLCWRLQSWGRGLSTCRRRVVVLKIVVRENGSVQEALEDVPSRWYLIKSVELNSKSFSSRKPRKIQYVVAIWVGDTMDNWKMSFEAA